MNLRRGENIYKLQLNKHLFNTSKTRNRNISIQTEYPGMCPSISRLEVAELKPKSKIQTK